MCAHWHNGYVLSLSSFCTFMHTSKENSVTNEVIVLEWLVSSAFWDFKVAKRRGHVKAAASCKKTITRESDNFASEEEKRERKIFGGLVAFWFGTFTMSFCTTRSLVGHENIRRCCHKSLRFERFFVSSYIACLSYPYRVYPLYNSIMWHHNISFVSSKFGGVFFFPIH